MEAVKETIQLNEARDVYLTAFKKRYGKSHLGISQSDDQALGMCVRKVKNRKDLHSIIQHYFTMDGLSAEQPFFKNQTHPIHLLLKYMNQVWGAYCSSSQSTVQATRQIGVTVDGVPVFENVKL